MNKKWTVEKAQEWYERQPWPCGFNYIPAKAVSYTEMFMDYAFDPTVIDKELRMAESVGFNCVRVVLPFIVWENEPQLFKKRLDCFLEICYKRKQKVMLALFDDCCFGDQINPRYEKQPDMIPGWYGNGWTPSPGHDMVRDDKQWSRLEPYVKNIVGDFQDDERVWIWDLYNEPTNGVSIGAMTLPLGAIVIPLLKKIVEWAREINPSQPLTIGKWNDNAALNDIALNEMDVISFHNYLSSDCLEKEIEALQRLKRPVICTEWLNRYTNSVPASCLPVFKKNKVGAMHWGLVNGKTQTHLPWKSLPGCSTPSVWQHDLYHGDYTPYDDGEINFFKETIKA